MVTDEVLFKKNRDEYGEDYRTHYLEVYKLYVEMADRISTRRQGANSFFLTVNSAIIAVLGYVQFGVYLGAKLGLDQSQTNDFYLIISILGMLLCVIWFRIIQSYKQLNSVKFKIIHHMEQNLPLAPYEAEWSVVNGGKDNALYMPLSHVETMIPWAFFVLNVAVFLKIIVKNTC